MNIPKNWSPCNLRLTPDRGCLRATFDVTAEGDTIQEFRIIRQAGQKAWVQAPQKAFRTEDGALTFRPKFKLDKADKKRLEYIILPQFERLSEEARR